jgi:hypothetical protein
MYDSGSNMYDWETKIYDVETKNWLPLPSDHYVAFWTSQEIKSPPPPSDDYVAFW